MFLRHVLQCTSLVMQPEVIRCFRSFNIRHPRPGDPARSDQAPACVVQGSPRLSNSYLDAFSPASVIFLMALLLGSFSALTSNWPANHPWGCTVSSIPCFPSYLALFLSKASSIHFSEETVNSCRTTCLVDCETRTLSGLNVVTAMVSGNLSCFRRSTFSCQSCAVARGPPGRLGRCCGFSPVLTKVMECLAGCCCPLAGIPMLLNYG